MTFRLVKVLSAPARIRQPGLLGCTVRQPGLLGCTVRWESTLSGQVVHEEGKEGATAKPFEAIPGPKGLPFVGTALHAVLGGWMNTFHLHVQNRWRQYGSIYKENLGPLNVVAIQDPEDVAAVLRAEGRYPKRFTLVSFTMAIADLDEHYGVFLGNGEEWHRYRTLLNKRLMRPQQAAVFTPMMDEAACDFVPYVYLRRKRDHDGMVTDVQGHLFRWAMESGCTALFNQHLGLLSKDPPQLTKDFIDSVVKVLETTNTMLIIPPKVHRALNTKAWKGHMDGWGTMFRVAKELIEDKMKIELERKDEEGEITDLASYLISKDLSPKEVLGNLMDLLGGAVDTTSNTMTFTLHALARLPNIQEKLHDEVMSFAPDHQAPVTQEQVHKMPYLRGLIKEILRLYPPAYINSRILQHDAVIHGYKIPMGTNIQFSPYVMGRNPDLFDSPEEIRPERWYRENSKAVKAFSWLPFGFGPRGCVGRRIAETEMHLALIRICQNFRLEQQNTEALVGKIRLLLVPEKSVDLKVIDRN